MRFLPATTLFLLIIFSLSSRAASAAKPSNGLEVSPAFLEVTIESPKEEIEIPITFTNHSHKEITLDLSPIDFKQQDDFGGIGFLGLNSSYSYSLSSFLTFPSRQIIIPATTSKVVQVTLTNRDDLSPGGHYAAVVGKLTQDKEPGSGLETQVSPSISSLLLVRKKGGERFNLSLLKTSWPDSAVVFTMPRVMTLHFQNEGNIHVTPYGRIEVRDMFGRLIADGSINPASLIILPESRRYVEGLITPLAWSLPISINTLSIRGNDSLKKTQYVYKEVFLSVSPWTALVLLWIPVVIISKKRKIKSEK